MEPNAKFCRVCLQEHDEEIHAATLSLREWFREQVMLSFYWDEYEPVAAEPEPALAATA